MIEIAAIALVFLIFSLLSRRLANTVISAPMFFLLAGILLASDLVRIVSFEDAAPLLLYVGVAALGLSFFTDASRISLAALPGNISLPARLLLVGLPLTFLLGTLLAYWLMPELTWVEAALLAVILHGVSAIPLVAWYSRRMERLGVKAPENRQVNEIPVRLGWTQLAEHSDQRVSEWEARREQDSNVGRGKDEN